MAFFVFFFSERIFCPRPPMVRSSFFLDFPLGVKGTPFLRPEHFPFSGSFLNFFLFFFVPFCLPPSFPSQIWASFLPLIQVPSFFYVLPFSVAFPSVSHFSVVPYKRLTLLRVLDERFPLPFLLLDFTSVLPPFPVLLFRLSSSSLSLPLSPSLARHSFPRSSPFPSLVAGAPLVFVPQRHSW